MSILTRGQNVTFNKDDIYLELLFIEEKTKDSLPLSIVEIYSGGKRIDAGMSDYQGICFLVLEKEDVVNGKINLKVYGLKCKPHKQKMSLYEGLNTTIKLKYGKTEYNSRDDQLYMMKKLNFPDPEPWRCGTVD
jgi:hypothetical protein